MVHTTILISIKFGIILFQLFKKIFLYQCNVSVLNTGYSPQEGSMKKVLFFTPFIQNEEFGILGLQPEKLAKVNIREKEKLQMQSFLTPK